MLVFGTQMHIVTFLFVCMETVILFYLIIHHFARPDDDTCFLNIILIVLLLIYNITGGLLPDSKLPGFYDLQESIAYGTGFITPCFFPYYVYRGFGLEKMKFHAKRGVFLFLVLPYIAFVITLVVTKSMDDAKNLLILPAAYALWVLVSLGKAIRFKYHNDFSSANAKQERVILFISLAPWLGLPFISYFDLSQWLEAIITNGGFLLLLAFHLNRHVVQLREEHERLIESEKKLQTWNEELRAEVDKRTKELEMITREERFNENCRKYKLTQREKEISKLICGGHSYKYIGAQLFIAERTVAKHAQNIFEKVGVSNKMELREKLEAVINSA